MAFAPPDPKRVEADKRRIEQRRLDDIRAIEEQRRIQQEIRSCYHPFGDEVNGVKTTGHSPKQIANAAKMQAAGRLHDHLEGVTLGIKPSWTRIGRSRGGKQKRNLYVCNRTWA